MRRIVASALVACSVAACAASVVTASDALAAGQLLDPGWQIAYTGQLDAGGAVAGGGLIQNLFGDGGEPPVVGSAYQPAPMYYQPRAYQPAPMYYQPRANQPAPVPRVYRPAPVYYQSALPAQQPRTYRPAPVYYRPVPAQQVGVSQPAPVYYRQVPMPQARANQTAPQDTASRQPAAYPSTPQYTASIQPRDAAPAAPHQGLLQLAAAPQQSTAPPIPQYFASTPAPASLHGLFQFSPAPQPVVYGPSTPGYAPSEYGDMAHPPVDPKYDRQVVDYHGTEALGTVIIDTPHYFLYLVLEGGKALRYGIGVGRPGFTWAGVKTVTAKREWPDWYPPPDMIERRPDLPRYMAGGPENPLGARALYLGSTLYRIHGSNEPWTIGMQVSSGCIRLRNADIIDLYNRVKVGTKVVVL